MMFICMPSFPIINPFYLYTRYVEYDEYGNNPLVIEVGEMAANGQIWRAVNNPRGPARW